MPSQNAARTGKCLDFRVIYLSADKISYPRELVYNYLKVVHILGDDVEIVYSVNGVPIRLTDERWEHVVSNKPYMEAYYERVLDAVEKPTLVLRGYAGSLVAVLSVGRQRYLHVVYKEISQQDGFIITAFIARKYNRRMIVWSWDSWKKGI